MPRNYTGRGKCTHRVVENLVSEYMKPRDQNFVSQSFEKVKYRVCSSLATDP